MRSCVLEFANFVGREFEVGFKNVLIVGVNASSLSCGDYCKWVLLPTSGFFFAWQFQGICCDGMVTSMKYRVRVRLEYR